MSTIPRRHTTELEIDWTPEEHWRLKTLAKRKISAAQIAKILGRRVGSVRREAEQLGLLLYKR
jgi:IS30 family transposase